MTEEQSTDIAKKWMEIADTDGSGTIDLNEFKEFITKIDESITEDSTKQIFASIDEDGDGELSVAEFGKAIHESFKGMKADEEEVADKMDEIKEL